jgi:hypothetical protein
VRGRHRRHPGSDASGLIGDRGRQARFKAGWHPGRQAYASRRARASRRPLEPRAVRALPCAPGVQYSRSALCLQSVPSRSLNC